MIEHFVEDVRHALRGLRHDPVLALTAAATLALCIGANTTVFSLVNTILIRPLPYPAADRIYWISELSGRTRSEGGAGPDYYILREENKAFEDVAAFDTTTLNWTGLDKPEQLDAAQVTPSFFRVMGTQPMLGRTLASGEEGVKTAPVVILSYAFWRNRMGGDRNIAGRTLVLDGLTNTIIGVMPQGFDYPNATQIWKPLDMDESTQRPILTTRPMRIVNMLARRKPGVGQTQLETEMARLTQAVSEEYPKEFRNAGFRSHLSISAQSLQERITGDLKPALLVLSGAVGLVLLIACVNLANLMLARASARQRELAVRLALGSSRERIIRQMLTESMVLALPGGLAGVAIAWVAVAFLNATKPLVLVRHPPISLDLQTLAFTFALTLVTGLLFGMAPAWTAARVSIHDTLKGSSQSHSAAHGSTRLRQILLTTELSVSLVLLIGAGLLSRSFLKIARTELGFPTDHLLTLRMNLTNSRYASAESQSAFYDGVLERIQQLPAARGAAISTDLPLSQFNGAVGFQAEGSSIPLALRPRAGLTWVSPQYFNALGVQLKSGRTFDSQDTSKTGPKLVVNAVLAHTVFGGEDPLGRRLVAGPRNDLIGTVVGVVADIRQRALGAEPIPLIYECTCQGINRFMNRMSLIVRTAGDPHAVIPDVESQIYSVDREQPVFDVRTMEERVERSLAPQRFQLILIGAFAAIALILAVAGVYGVMSYLVARRTREIGIRMALGARPQQVQSLVVRESLMLVVIAVVAGLGGAWALTRYVRSMLYGVTALDEVTFAITPLILALIVLSAAFGPARRASRIDPMSALREE